MPVLIALLDACVLYPAALRDTLLRAALHGLYRPQWSAGIAAALKKPSVPFERVLETLEQQVPVFVSWVRHNLQDDADLNERSDSD